MTLKGLTHRLLVQLHIALALIAYKAAAAGNSTKPEQKRDARRRELNDPYWFNMRLFWKQGYQWQESYKEQKYCMQCKSNRCPQGSGLKVSHCDKGDWRQHFFYDSGRIRSRRNKAVCLERQGRSIVLANCNGSRSGQKWAQLRREVPFQLRIPGNTEKCASQHHHPKPNEPVYMTSCKKSVFSQSDKWITY